MLLFILFIFLYWIFKGLAFLILCFLLKIIDLVLSSRKWMLSLLSSKISIAKNSNQHYNHKLIKLFERSFTGVCVNFNMELWFLQSYQNSNFEELWIGWFWECPFSLGGWHSYSFFLIFFISIRFFMQFVWSYQTHKC